MAMYAGCMNYVVAFTFATENLELDTFLLTLPWSKGNRMEMI